MSLFPFSFFFSVSVYVSAVCMCSGTHACAYLQKPEVNLKKISQKLSILIIQTGFLSSLELTE